MKNHPRMIDQISNSNSPQSLYCQTSLTHMNPVGSRLMENRKIHPPSKHIFMNSLHILRYNVHEIIHGSIMMCSLDCLHFLLTRDVKFLKILLSKHLEQGVWLGLHTWASHKTWRESLIWTQTLHHPLYRTNWFFGLNLIKF